MSLPGSAGNSVATRTQRRIFYDALTGSDTTSGMPRDLEPYLGSGEVPGSGGGVRILLTL